MKKNTAIQFFGSQSKLAAALNISSAAISLWGDEVPKLRAYQIAELTGGALKIETKSNQYLKHS